MKHIKTLLLSIIASVAIVYLITIAFSSFTFSYNPMSKDIEQKKYILNTKFKSVLGIKIEVEEFYTNEEALFEALESSPSFFNKLGYYNQAVKLSIRYIFILIPVLFFILYTREKQKINIC
ncbi:hypothetical protein [Flavobacterium sp.]|jgi:hypothetical protein|uniref:hypothetical protein n=1 Tax=Flavobacterium sp. TaxID=239 RepID=UPI002A83552F|nr:hypothetical protein [Flavobacterium sp.]